MANWSDLFLSQLTQTFGQAPDAKEILQRFAWVDELYATGKELLIPETLEEMPAHEVYEKLRQLSFPGCPIRITNLGRMNNAQGVRDAVVRLLKTPGDFEEKYRAAKIAQTGIVTITELLCVARPMRFVLRNTAFTRALAKVAPFYTAKGLSELPYPEFLDLCMELAKILKRYLEPAGLGAWADERRFLLLYAVITHLK